MNSLTTALLIFILLIVPITMLNAQEQSDERLPLTFILSEVEDRYNIRFSYGDKTVENIVCKRPNYTNTLEEVIFSLKACSNLSFEILNDRFIVVTSTTAESPEMKVERLNEVVIENYLTRGLSKNVDGKIRIATQDFNILPGLTEPDILQTIQSLPGVISVDERISNINIRGGTNDQNLILFEGIKMYQSGHFFGLISAFYPYLAEETNVSKNGTSAKYGDGVSGVITINNSNTIDQKNTFGGGLNLLSADGFSKISINESSELQLSARRSFTDVVLSPTYNAYFDRIFRDSEFNSESNVMRNQNERFHFFDVNGKYLYDFKDDSKLRFNLLHIYNNLDYSESTLNSNNQAESSESRLNQKSYGASLNYTKQWSKLATDLQLYVSNYRLDGITNDITNNQRLIQENEVVDLGIMANLNIPFSPSTVLNTGYQFNEVGVTNLEDINDPRFRNFIKEVLRTHSLYSEFEFRSNNNKTYARLGLRGNFIEKFSDFYFEPRISFNQKFLRYLRLEILGELKSQSIAQIIDLQQDFFGIEKRRWQLADDDKVPVITSQQASIGLNYNRNGFLINAEAYIKNVDGITARSQGFQNQFQLVNDTGAYTIKGVDFLINKQFNKLSTWLSYSYSKNDYHFKNLNNSTEFPKNIDIRNIINASVTYNFNALKVGVGMNWHSGRP
ncbi:MAG: TonB-dependent receptor plug domain-containing protein, partial [Winogradskyella sp.]|nr:TonB-dependent receptor plug domain-containing protein [Winogradskyella sp.]